MTMQQTTRTERAREEQHDRKEQGTLSTTSNSIKISIPSICINTNQSLLQNMQRAHPPPPPRNQSSAPSTPAYFTENELPSCKMGFYSPKEERTTRRKTCRFLEEAGRVLKIPRVTISTSMVIFHRFYAVHSFKDHDRFEVAVACILLAAKTEESPKKLVSVVQECYRLKSRSAAKKNVDLPGVKFVKDGYLDIKCEEFVKLKERVLLLERVILHTIGFELSIDHPYTNLVHQIRSLVSSKKVEFIDPNETEPLDKSLLQNAMNFANDSMQTPLCLQFEAKVIAQTCVYMSGLFSKVRPTDGKQWLDVLDVDMVDLASVALQIMQLIADTKKMDEYKPIMAELEKMKEALGGPGSSRKSSASGGGGGQPRPPSSGERDPKRPRN